MRWILLASLVFLFACDDDDSPSSDQQGDADAAVSADGAPGADSAIADPDSATPDPDAGRQSVSLPAAGLWHMAIKFVDVGDIVIEFQLEIASDGVDTLTSVALRVLDQDGEVSPDIAVLEDIVVGDDGSFELAFEDTTLPGPFSPTGTPIDASLVAVGTLREDGSMCGTVSGDVATLGIELEMSTFGAVPWDARPAPAGCDEAPPVELPTIGPADRPAPVILPTAYAERDSQWPLVVLLHGFSTTGELQDGYLGLSRSVDTHGFVLLRPDGTVNEEGDQFWNATPACCDNFDSGVDDVAYLSALIDEALATYNVDPRRVYLVGHSNGGFMAYRMACDAGEKLAGIGTLAGAVYQNPMDCPAAANLSVLHLHATDDASVPYMGRPGDDGYPPAETAGARWAERNGCAEGSMETGRLDLIESIEGDETVRLAWSGCEDDTAVEVWRHEGGGHVPGFRDAFADNVIPWLLERARPVE